MDQAHERGFEAATLYLEDVERYPKETKPGGIEEFWQDHIQNTQGYLSENNLGDQSDDQWAVDKKSFLAGFEKAVKQTPEDHPNFERLNEFRGDFNLEGSPKPEGWENLDEYEKQNEAEDMEHWEREAAEEETPEDDDEGLPGGPKAQGVQQDQPSKSSRCETGTHKDPKTGQCKPI